MPTAALATDDRPLSAVARHVVAPVEIAATSWPKVRDTCHRLGWGFDGWQDGGGRLILAKRTDGSYAADTVAISIPRQAGKTYLIACIIFALCLLEPGTTVIWTAHRKSTARETFDQFDGMSLRPKVAPHIRQVLRGKGDESILFNNGSRILFGARESGFGRGFAGVDVLVCDEGQILPESTLEDLGATQNTAPNPLFFVMGTPPRPKDAGEYFTALRQEALDGESDTTLYIETSADRGAEAMDTEQLRKANPSFPHRTTYRALLRLRKKLKSPDSWNREALGIWDQVSVHTAVFRAAAWATLADDGPDFSARPDGMAVDMSHAREISVAACWPNGDKSHLEEVWAGVDEPAAVEWIVQAAGRRVPVVIDSQSPAASMIPTLKARGVKVVSGSAAVMGQACGGWLAAANANLLSHSDQEVIAAAIAGVRRRAIGKAGAFGWDRTDPAVNIAPLVSITLALFASSIRKKRQSAGARRAVVMS